MGNYRYKAFISYSHKDHRWGRWLHRRLENYRIPKHLKSINTPGESSARLKPIFRDREELAAADSLGDKIEQALAASECLIVICSPQAAKSHWVNKEILSFKRANRGAKIFSLIIEGEPFAKNTDEECMPPALRFQIGTDGNLTDHPAEPLAADLRKTGDGKRYGTLKLISGMLGVGLDELVQRDLQKNRNRVTAITVGALSTVLAMGTLTGFAVSARKQAETSRVEADNRRDAAEEMIEFMITELKPELEAVGRLKPLSIVGERAVIYYDDQPLSAHNDNALGRRARVFHLIGEIEDKYGNLDKAQARFDEAYASTKALLARDPNNPDRIFDHAQSAYWAGYVLWKTGKYKIAEPFFLEYIDKAEALKLIEPETLRALQEITYAYTNMGTLLFKQYQYERSYQLYLSALPSYESIALSQPANTQFQLDLGNIYGWLADTTTELLFIEEALQYRDKQIALYNKLGNIDPTNNNIKYEHFSAIIGHIQLLRLQGKLDTASTVAQSGYIKSLELYQSDSLNSAWGENLLFFLYEKILISIAQNNKVASLNLLEEIYHLRVNLPEGGIRNPQAIEKLHLKTINNYNLKFNEHYLNKSQK